MTCKYLINWIVEYFQIIIDFEFYQVSFEPVAIIQ